MTEREKKELIEILKKEFHEELAIYVGNKTLRYIAKLIGITIIALSYYLISHGYLKL